MPAQCYRVDHIRNILICPRPQIETLPGLTARLRQVEVHQRAKIIGYLSRSVKRPTASILVAITIRKTPESLSHSTVDHRYHTWRTSEAKHVISTHTKLISYKEMYRKKEGGKPRINYVNDLNKWTEITNMEFKKYRGHAKTQIAISGYNPQR